MGKAIKVARLDRRLLDGVMMCFVKVACRSAAVVAAMVVMSNCSSDSRDKEKVTEAPPPPPPKKWVVYVVNYPLEYFAQRIGGEKVEVRFPTPVGEDPAFWRPDAKVVLAYQAADLILLNGADYAKWVATTTLPQSKVVDTSEGFQARYIRVEGGPAHQHGPNGKMHSHAGTAFTTWLDLSQAAEQAGAIEAALSKLDPESADYYGKQCRILQSDLMALDGQITELINHAPGKALVASHPVYQYFARRYGLDLKAMCWEPEIVPDEKEWNALEQILKEHKAEWMLWEGPPRQETVERLKKMGVGSVVVEPCGNVLEGRDFFEVMRQNLQNLQVIWMGK